MLGSNKTLRYVLQFVLHAVRIRNFGSLSCVFISPYQGGRYLQFLTSPVVVYYSFRIHFNKILIMSTRFPTSRGILLAPPPGFLTISLLIEN